MIRILKFIKSKAEPGDFLDIQGYLSEIGYKTYEDKQLLVSDLVEDGYLIFAKSPRDVHASDNAHVNTGREDNSPISVKLTKKADRLLRYEQTRDLDTDSSSRSTGTVNTNAVLVAVCVLFAAFGYIILDKYKIIRDQRATISQLQIRVKFLEQQALIQADTTREISE